MSNSKQQDERSRVRRSDRAVQDEAWIADLLRRAPLGFIATSVDGQPFINSNIFVYDANARAIFFHTARKGRTRANVADGANVCLTVAEMGRLLPADTALEFSVEYNSVVVFGRATLVHDESAAIEALQALLDKYFTHLTAGKDYRPPVPEELKRTSVFRLDIESWSGKMKKVGDFPGAFAYPGPGQLSVDAGEPGNLAAHTRLHREGYELSTDDDRLDVDLVHAFLSQASYWAKGRSRETVVRSIQNSLCFGVYKGSAQVGFARVITDYAVRAYIADVFIVPEHRGSGLGKWLVEAILSHPSLQDVSRWSLDTMDAHGLYEKFGFTVVEPGRHMGLRKVNR